MPKVNTMDVCKDTRASMLITTKKKACIAKSFYWIWMPNRMFLAMFIGPKNDVFNDVFLQLITSSSVLVYSGYEKALSGFQIFKHIINAVHSYACPRGFWEFAIRSTSAQFVRQDCMNACFCPTNDICTPAPLCNVKVTHGHLFQLSHKWSSLCPSLWSWRRKQWQIWAWSGLQLRVVLWNFIKNV